MGIEATSKVPEFFFPLLLKGGFIFKADIDFVLGKTHTQPNGTRGDHIVMQI